MIIIHAYLFVHNIIFYTMKSVLYRYIKIYNLFKKIKTKLSLIIQLCRI